MKIVQYLIHQTLRQTIAGLALIVVADASHAGLKSGAARVAGLKAALLAGQD
jgi:hypothetical protein